MLEDKWPSFIDYKLLLWSAITCQPSRNESRFYYAKLAHVNQKLDFRHLSHSKILFRSHLVKYFGIKLLRDATQVESVTHIWQDLKTAFI